MIQYLVVGVGVRGEPRVGQVEAARPTLAIVVGTSKTGRRIVRTRWPALPCLPSRITATLLSWFWATYSSATPAQQPVTVGQQVAAQSDTRGAPGASG